MQKILSVDSQILNSIQSCARKTQYSFIQNLRPVEKPAAMEKGALMHSMLEVFYSLKLGTIRGKTWDELLSAGVKPGKPIDTAIEAGFYFATKMDIPVEVCEEVIFQFREYCDHYKFDAWNPLSVEDVGSKILFENEDIRLVYNFKIDLIAEKGHIVAPFDHKTSSQNKAPSSMSNQFIGYAWALNTNTVVVNKIGFQKTLSPGQRFQRHILTIDDDRIREWKSNSIFWLLRLYEHITDNSWPMNLTSCDKYGSCIYREVCESSPLSRERKLEQLFERGEAWDVSKELTK